MYVDRCKQKSRAIIHPPGTGAEGYRCLVPPYRRYQKRRREHALFARNRGTKAENKGTMDDALDEGENVFLSLPVLHKAVLATHKRLEELSKLDKDDDSADVTRNVVVQTLADLDPVLVQVDNAFERLKGKVTHAVRNSVTQQLEPHVVGLGFEYFLTKGLPTIVKDLFHVRVEEKGIVEDLNQFFRRASHFLQHLIGLCVR